MKYSHRYIYLLPIILVCDMNSIDIKFLIEIDHFRGQTVPLEEVFKRLSNITPLHIISLCKKYSQFGLYLDIGQLKVDSNFQFKKEYYD